MFSKLNTLGRKARLGFLSAMVAAFAIVPAAAFAQEEGGQSVEQLVGDELAGVQSMLTSIMGPALLTIAVVGVGIGIGIKYLRKGRSAA